MNQHLPRKYQHSNKGFTLIELLLVLGVAMILSVLAIQKLVSEQNRTVAKAVGEQMQQIAEASNAYIIAHYREIVGIIPSSTTGLDCGDTVGVTPTGSDPGRTCTISMQALVDEGFLPSGYPQTTSFDPTNQWQIRLRMANLVPPFNVEGLLISQNPWVKGDSAQTDETLAQIEAEKIGIAIRTGGPDAGAVNLSVGANVPDKLFESFGGSFSLGAVSNVAGLAGFPEIRQQGQIGMRLGSASTAMSSYARRDGSAPFTGNLDMGGNDVVNANNISTSGSMSAAGNVNAGNDLNAAGDVTTTNLYAADSVNAINSINAQQVNTTVSVNTPAINLQGGSLVIGMANDAVIGGAAAFGTATPAQGAISFGSFFDRATGSSSIDPKIPLVVEGAGCSADSTSSTPSRSVGINANGDILTCQGAVWRKTKAAQIIASENQSCVQGGITYQTAIDAATGSLLTCNTGSNQFRYQGIKLSTETAACNPGEIARDVDGNLLSCRPNGQFDRAEPQLPEGSMCGMRVTGDGRGPRIRPCMGMDPIVGCPDGYEVHSWPGFDYVWHHSCMKVDTPGSGAPVVVAATPPEDGVCGPARGVPTATAPVSNLCSVGTSSGAIDAGSSFIWNCQGNNGGAAPICSAPKDVAPTAGASNGQCGPASGRTYTTSPPVGDLCSAGPASPVSNNPSAWSWSCGGFDGGATASCLALKPATAAKPWTTEFSGQCRAFTSSYASTTMCVNPDGTLRASSGSFVLRTLPVPIGFLETSVVTGSTACGGQPYEKFSARPVIALDGTFTNFIAQYVSSPSNCGDGGQ